MGVSTLGKMKERCEGFSKSFTTLHLHVYHVLGTERVTTAHWDVVSKEELLVPELLGYQPEEEENLNLRFAWNILC